jgi:hypothetical protein
MYKIFFITLFPLLINSIKSLSIEKTQFIQNVNVPLCKNCVYFNDYKLPGFYDLGKCTKFGKMDIISGEITYEYAYSSRNDKDLCSFNGTYFEERKHPDITLSIFQKE